MRFVNKQSVTRELAHENYNAMLESYYSDLLLGEKAGKITAEDHSALETFLSELRELVAEVNAEGLKKAA